MERDTEAAENRPKGIVGEGVWRGSHIASADRGWGWVFWIPNCLLCSGRQAGLPANTHRFLGTASEVSLWDRCIWEAPLTLKDYGGGGSDSSLQQRTCFLFCNSGYKMCRRPASDQRRGALGAKAGGDGSQGTHASPSLVLRRPCKNSTGRHAPEIPALWRQRQGDPKANLLVNQV